MTIDIFGENRFLNIYKNRIHGLENSISTFLVHLSFYENTFEYLNYNIYQHHNEDVWAGIDYDEATWPQTYFICTPFISKHKKYADSMSVMTYMNSSETDQWAHTAKTVSEPGERDADYDQFKKEKEAKSFKAD